MVETGLDMNGEDDLLPVASGLWRLGITLNTPTCSFRQRPCFSTSIAAAVISFVTCWPY